MTCGGRLPDLSCDLPDVNTSRGRLPRDSSQRGVNVTAIRRCDLGDKCCHSLNVECATPQTLGVGPTPALFERELLLICSARSGSRSVTPSGGFHLSGVDAIGHVVSGQTRTSRAGTEVSSAVEQSLDGGRMFLFHGPHQSRRTAQVFFRVHVRSGRKQNPYRFRVAVARRKHDHRFPVRSALFRIRTSLEEFLDHRGVTVETSHGQRSNPLTIRYVHLFAGAN